MDKYLISLAISIVVLLIINRHFLNWYFNKFTKDVSQHITEINASEFTKHANKLTQHVDKNTDNLEKQILEWIDNDKNNK